MAKQLKKKINEYNNVFKKMCSGVSLCLSEDGNGVVCKLIRPTGNGEIHTNLGTFEPNDLSSVELFNRGLNDMFEKFERTLNSISGLHSRDMYWFENEVEYPYNALESLVKDGAFLKAYGDMNVKKGLEKLEANKKVVAKQPTDSKEVSKEAKCQKEEVK